MLFDKTFPIVKVINDSTLVRCDENKYLIIVGEIQNR